MLHAVKLRLTTPIHKIITHIHYYTATCSVSSQKQNIS